MQPKPPTKPTLDGLERKWSDRWARSGVYRFDRTRPRVEVFSIDTPPPTVSGHLHLARYGVAELGMAVAAGWRGRGIGSALLAEAIDQARKAGAHKVALQVWPHNAAAIALYERFGFQREGYLHRHYRRRSGELWDAIIMGLRLD